MSKPKTPNQKRKYSELNTRLAKYVALIEEIYEQLNLEAAKLVSNSTDYNADSDNPFRWSDYPQTRKKIADIQKQFVEDIQAVIYRGTSEEWKNSNEVQDLLANAVLRAYDAQVDGEQYLIYYQENSDALRAFQERKDKGLNVSDKLWQQSVIYKQGLEDAISCAIQKGTSAVTLSKQISKYLQDFPQLQKDYKERFGKASRAKDCEYRSIRLARSEINMAYRQAENQRWQQMDFVVGYEIKLSGSHHVDDICDQLKGRYPKTFVWTGWHPNDMCYKIPILKTEEEFWEWDGRGEATTNSVNEVKDVPDRFKQWVGTNSQRIADAKKRGTLPYFIRDNKSIIKMILNEPPRYKDYLINGIKQMHVLDGANYNLTKIVSDIEADIRMNKRYETGVCVDLKGNVIIDKRGSYQSIAFTAEECAMMKDCIFTHNHPSGWSYPGNDICRIGNSFSCQDMALCIYHDLIEIRAVTPNYTFSMKRPSGGWNVTPSEIQKDFDAVSNKLHKEFTRRINNGTMTIGQATATHFHILWKQLSKKYGWEYDKQKTR